MATTYKIKSEGNYLVIEDNGGTDKWNKRIVDIEIFRGNDNTDFYTFVDKVAGTVFFDGLLSEFVDDSLTPYTSKTFETFYRRLKKNASLEVDTTHAAVSVNKTTATTLLAMNWQRNGMAFSNTGTLDVYLRFKEAATDNNQEGIVLKAGEQKVFQNVSYIDEVSAIRTSTTGNQTTSVQCVEW